MIEFEGFPKIARLSREAIITEKIDGTNAQIYIGEDGQIIAGSRTRWITPDSDNFGFARWGEQHRVELAALGPGRHFGEWWGSGIQRGYGLENGPETGRRIHPASSPVHHPVRGNRKDPGQAFGDAHEPQPAKPRLHVGCTPQFDEKPQSDCRLWRALH